jgi:molybdopterin converting factor small subunit
MPTLRIPTPLRAYTGGQSEVPVQGQTVSQAIQDLVQRYPAIQPHLYKAPDELRSFVNLFLNEDNINDLQGLETPLAENDRLMLIPSIAGGVNDVP